MCVILVLAPTILTMCSFEETKQPYLYPNHVQCPSKIVAEGQINAQNYWCTRENEYCAYNCATACPGCEFQKTHGDPSSCEIVLACTWHTIWPPNQGVLLSTRRLVWKKVRRLVWKKTVRPPSDVDCGRPVCMLPGHGGSYVPAGWAGTHTQCNIKITVLCVYNEEDTTSTHIAMYPALDDIKEKLDSSCHKACYKEHERSDFRDKHGFECSDWEPHLCAEAEGWWGFYHYDWRDAHRIRLNCPMSCYPSLCTPVKRESTVFPIFSGIIR